MIKNLPHTLWFYAVTIPKEYTGVVEENGAKYRNEIKLSLTIHKFITIITI